VAVRDVMQHREQKSFCFFFFRKRRFFFAGDNNTRVMGGAFAYPSYGWTAIEVRMTPVMASISKARVQSMLMAMPGPRLAGSFR
jgi:hypothetical protein